MKVQHILMHYIHVLLFYQYEHISDYLHKVLLLKVQHTPNAVYNVLFFSSTHFLCCNFTFQIVDYIHVVLLMTVRNVHKGLSIERPSCKPYAVHFL